LGLVPYINIADLKPCLGEEDELESRTTQMQEWEDNEDINTTNTSTPALTPASPIPLGPITPARARQLNHQISSLLSSYPSYVDNGDTCTLVLVINDGV